MESTSSIRDSLRPRDDNLIYLVGKEIHQPIGFKLASRRQVLGLLFFHIRSEGMKLHTGSLKVADELILFWREFNIPSQRNPRVAKNVEKLHNEWRNLHKSAVRGGSTHEENEKTFFDCLDDLFDIAHQDALSIIETQEDKYFLIAQRQKNRQGYMSNLDTSFVGIAKRRLEREQQSQERRERAAADMQNTQARNTIIVDGSQFYNC